MNESEIEREIRAFFEEAADSKLDLESDGSLFDHDSNWGFDPAALAKRLARQMADAK